MERQNLFRESLRRCAVGFPWGAAGVYLIFLIGNLFSIPAPENGVFVVSGALLNRWGNPVTAALVQFLWSGLLGAVLANAGTPFLAERGTLLWSGLHFLLTAAVFSLAGWQCGWFPYTETWLCLLGLLLLCYLLMWAVHWIGWRHDLRLLRQSAGLLLADGNSHKKDASDLDGSTIGGNSHKKDAHNLGSPPTGGNLTKNNAGKLVVPTEKKTLFSRQILPYLLLAALVELLLPWLLRAVDAPDVPVLTGFFYPFLILPLFCFISAHSAGRRCHPAWILGYALSCGLLAVPNVFLLYNYTALFHAWTAGIAALLGGLSGWFRRKTGR